MLKIGDHLITPTHGTWVIASLPNQFTKDCSVVLERYRPVFASVLVVGSDTLQKSITGQNLLAGLNNGYYTHEPRDRPGGFWRG